MSARHGDRSPPCHLQRLLQVTVHLLAAPAKAPRTLLTQRPMSIHQSCWADSDASYLWGMECLSMPALLTSLNLILIQQESHGNSLPLSCNTRGSSGGNSPWRSHLGQSISKAMVMVPAGIGEAGRGRQVVKGGGLLRFCFETNTPLQDRPI